MSHLSNKNCSLIITLFLNIADILLAGFSFTILISKRKLEKKPRSHIVWMFDVSKQIIGGTLIHLINIASKTFIFKSYHNKHIWNFVNFFIDSTLGVIIVSGSHIILCRLCTLYFGESSSCSKIGYYGHPPNYRVWIKQLVPYLISLILSRIITFSILSESNSFLLILGEQSFFLLYPYPTFEFIIILILCPWILTTFKLWIFDFILKDKQIEEVQYTSETSNTMCVSPVSNISNWDVKSSIEEENSDTETQITI